MSGTVCLPWLLVGFAAFSLVVFSLFIGNALTIWQARRAWRKKHGPKEEE